MDMLVAGLVAGILGTVFMDLGNLLFARLGLISRIDLRMIGRMAGGWVRGRFRYGHPSEMKKIENEAFYGLVTHYFIGFGLALPYVLGWALVSGEPASGALGVGAGGLVSAGWTLSSGGAASAAWAPVYGLATTAASWFFVYPCMGFGALGMRSPEGLKAPFSSLANHLFYGVGLAAALLVV
jgi:hypothetical protein